jgi:hypothetical protein
MQHLHQLNSFQARQSFMFGNNASPLLPNEPASPRAKRRSSTVRRSSVKYQQNFVTAEVDAEVGQQGVEVASSPAFSQELYIRKVDQSDAILEVLWLMQSSRVLKKVLKKSGTQPKDRISNFASTVVK